MTGSLRLIISRLSYDVNQGPFYHDQKIADMIADAKALRRNHANRRVIDRVMYNYSVILEKQSGESLYSFNEYNLNRDTYKRLLTFFKSL